MEKPASQSYLESQILTATPQKLRLMLIDGAIRFGRRTLQHWERDENEEALHTLIRCRNIVSELLASVRMDGGELTSQVAGLYLFLYQHLTGAQLRRDANQLREVLEVLETERETWRLVCEQMPDKPVGLKQTSSAPREIAAPATGVGDEHACGGNVSLDA